MWRPSKTTRTTLTFVYVGFLAGILAISIAVGLGLHSRIINKEEKGPYTVIGNLSFAPWHAITPGVSVISVTPSLSPSPGPLTFSEPDGQGGSINYTVDAFMMVSFNNHFTLPQGIPGFPSGFQENQEVKLTGSISFDETTQLYLMTVTGISHYPF